MWSDLLLAAWAGGVLATALMLWAQAPAQSSWLPQAFRDYPLRVIGATSMFVVLWPVTWVLLRGSARRER